jgi:hypothetical protein
MVGPFLAVRLLGPSFWLGNLVAGARGAEGSGAGFANGHLEVSSKSRIARWSAVQAEAACASPKMARQDGSVR